MIRLAICDDNLLQRSLAETMISDYAKERGLDMEMSNFASGDELLNAAAARPYDIYVLDMIMPEVNGMDVAKELRRRGDKGQIVFLTVSSDFAAESYEVDALYYIVKPLDPGVLAKVLDKAMLAVADKCLDFQVKTSQGYVLVRHKELMFAEAVSRAPVYHLTRGRVVKGLVLRTSFGESTKSILASGDFAYLGPSKLINLRFVEKMDDESVLLSDGTLVYGSKAACSAFHISWENFLVSRSRT